MKKLNTYLAELPAPKRSLYDRVLSFFKAKQGNREHLLNLKFPRKIFTIENPDEYDQKFGSLLEWGWVSKEDYYKVKEGVFRHNIPYSSNHTESKGVDADELERGVNEGRSRSHFSQYESKTPQGLIHPYSIRSATMDKSPTWFLSYLCPPACLLAYYWCRNKVSLVKMFCKSRLSI